MSQDGLCFQYVTRRPGSNPESNLGCSKKTSTHPSFCNVIYSKLIIFFDRNPKLFWIIEARWVSWGRKTTSWENFGSVFSYYPWKLSTVQRHLCLRLHNWAACVSQPVVPPYLLEHKVPFTCGGPRSHSFLLLSSGRRVRASPPP